MIPGSSGVPNIVCVFPAPVAPYAKTVALYPPMTPSIRNLVDFWKTSSYFMSSSKAKSNANVISLLRLPCRKASSGAASVSSFNTTIFWSIIRTFLTVCDMSSFFERGRTRTETKMFEFPYFSSAMYSLVSISITAASELYEACTICFDY